MIKILPWCANGVQRDKTSLPAYVLLQSLMFDIIALAWQSAGLHAEPPSIQEGVNFLFYVMNGRALLVLQHAVTHDSREVLCGLQAPTGGLLNHIPHL